MANMGEPTIKKKLMMFWPVWPVSYGNCAVSAKKGSTHALNCVEKNDQLGLGEPDPQYVRQVS